MSCGFTFASRRCTLTHTLFGVSCRDNVFLKDVVFWCLGFTKFVVTLFLFLAKKDVVCLDVFLVEIHEKTFFWTFFGGNPWIFLVWGGCFWFHC